MADNFDRYTEMFLDEASEHIEDLNQNLLRLERDGVETETINEIFRSAHTLKSSAAFVGLDHLSNLAHKMEDVLQRVKDSEVTVNTPLVNLLFRCLDRIKQAVGIVQDGNKPDDTYSDLIEALQEIAPSTAPSPKDKAAQAPKAAEQKVNVSEEKDLPEAPSKPEAKTDADATTRSFMESASADTTDVEHIPLTLSEDQKDALNSASGSHVFDGTVALDPESPMKNLRFLLLLMNLKKIGALVASDPSEAVLDEGTYDGFILRFVYKGNSTRDAVMKVCQVDMVEEVYLTDRETLPAPAAAGPKTATEVREKEPQVKKQTADPSLTMSDTHIKTRNIKVSSEKIDYLLNSVGELVITNSGLQKIYEDLLDEFEDSGPLSELKSKIDQAARIARDLQSGIMKTRMIPIGIVFHRFTRPVRDLALGLGKEVDLIFEGEDTELDKNIIDALNDPLLHLLRNSLDHGLETPEERRKAGKPETGKLVLNAYQSGNNIFVEINDDGRGLNRKAIEKKAVAMGLTENPETMSDEEIFNLIFHPGFSTAEKVSDVSGRGVGMNVVRKMVQEFKGSIQTQSRPGEGSSFILSFPLTLAIISAILVRVSDEEYAFPLSDVVETVRLTSSDITTLQGKDIINLRGEILPVFRMTELMGLPPGEDKEEFPVVIASVAGRKVGYIVDGMIGKKEIVIKTLEQNYKSVKGLIGACLMGDGSIVMVLDVQGLMDLAATLSGKDIASAALDHLASMEKGAVQATRMYNEKVHAIAWSGRRLAQRRGRRRAKAGDSAADTAAEEVITVPAEKEPEKEVAEEVKPQSTAPEASAPAEEKSVEKAKDTYSKPDSKSVTYFGEETRTAKPEPSQKDGALYEGTNEGGLRDKKDASSDIKSTDSNRLNEVLSEFEKDREERRHTAREVYKKSEQSDENELDRELSETEYNKLYGVINTGMVNAGLVLSQLLGVTVEVTVPEFKTVDFAHLATYLPEDKVIGVTLGTEGDFFAVLLLVFDQKTGYEAAGELMGLPVDNRNTENMSVEDVQSVLSELTNIVGSSILNELANKTGLSIQPTVPEYIHGTTTELIDRVQKEAHSELDSRLIYISTDFFREDTELLGRLFLLPSKPNLIDLISRL